MVDDARDAHEEVQGKDSVLTRELLLLTGVNNRGCCREDQNAA